MKPDSFRWLPVVLAASAIVISSLSWWEAHRGRLINEAVNRPVLAMDPSGIPTVNRLIDGKIMRQIRVKLEFKNLGKTSAIVDRASNRLLFFGECHLDEEPSSGQPLDVDEIVGKEAVPNLSLELRQTLTLNSECDTKTILFVSVGSIYYTDTVSKIQYTQDFLKFVEVPNATLNPRSR